MIRNDSKSCWLFRLHWLQSTILNVFRGVYVQRQPQNVCGLFDNLLSVTMFLCAQSLLLSLCLLHSTTFIHSYLYIFRVLYIFENVCLFTLDMRVSLKFEFCIFEFLENPFGVGCYVLCFSIMGESGK